MKILLTLLLALCLIALMDGHAFSEEEDVCAYFFLSLKEVPHDKLTRSDGEHLSVWDGKTYSGCEIKFITKRKLLSGNRVPGFRPSVGNEMYRLGWRANQSLVADGAGTGQFGVEKGDVLCMIMHEQPAFFDMFGNFIQNETLAITIQCRSR